MYVDAHLHPADYLDCCAASGNAGAARELFAQTVSLCCSAHEHTEYERHRSLFEQDVYSASCTQAADKTAVCAEGTAPQPSRSSLQSSKKQQIVFSFGIHPQNPVNDEAGFLYRLLQTKQIHAVGECGFDLFNDEYKQLLPMQQKVWDMQLQWAKEFQLPVVIHCRKALPLIFDSVSRLKKLPAVIFHGWGGSPQEAAAFLKKGVNAYFSIGKAVLRGQKSVCAMAASFDVTRLLTETDAPYMRLKAERYSHPHDVAAVTAQCANLRKYDEAAAKQTGLIRQYESCTAVLEKSTTPAEAVKELSDCIVRNFNRAFGLSR